VPARAQGRWSLVSRELGEVPTTPEAAAAAGLAVAALLLERHGVLTREAVRAEGVPGGFAGLYPVLRAMEEAGRIRRGYFVAGMGGSQFALPGALERLRGAREPVSPAPGAAGPEVTVLAATDPANAYGSSLPWPVKGPSRVAGAYVVSVAGVASLFVERAGRSLVPLRSFSGCGAGGGGGGWETAAVRALTALVAAGRWSRLVVLRYPEELADTLRAEGFVATPKGLSLYS
ncbi:MAG: Lhr family helicase, partial [Acidimicrobiales bacterium]